MSNKRRHEHSMGNFSMDNFSTNGLGGVFRERNKRVADKGVDLVEQARNERARRDALQAEIKRQRSFGE